MIKFKRFRNAAMFTIGVGLTALFGNGCASVPVVVIEEKKDEIVPLSFIEKDEYEDKTVGIITYTNKFGEVVRDIMVTPKGGSFLNPLWRDRTPEKEYNPFWVNQGKNIINKIYPENKYFIRDSDGKNKKEITEQEYESLKNQK